MATETSIAKCKWLRYSLPSQARPLTRTLNREERLVDSKITVWVIRQFSFFRPTVLKRCFSVRACLCHEWKSIVPDAATRRRAARIQVHKNFYNVYYQISQSPINAFNDVIQNAGILIRLDKYLSITEKECWTSRKYRNPLPFFKILKCYVTFLRIKILREIRYSNVSKKFTHKRCKIIIKRQLRKLNHYVLSAKLIDRIKRHDAKNAY